MFDMLDNYEDRKVAVYATNALLVSTVRVTDGDHPYETAVRHPAYNNDTMVIVEAYDTKESAEIGHKRWLGKMSVGYDLLPNKLIDCANSAISQICTIAGCNNTFNKQKDIK